MSYTQELLTEYPFNIFFANFFVYLFNFLRKHFDYFVTSDKNDLNRFFYIKEEFFSLFEFFNDLLTIEKKEFLFLLRSQFLSFFIFPLLKELLLNIKHSDQVTNQCFLILNLILKKLKDKKLCDLLKTIFLKDTLSSKFLELNIDSNDKIEGYRFEFKNEFFFDSKDPLILKQLKIIYEKILKRKIGSTTSWVSEILRAPIEKFKNYTSSPIKNFHKNYTKKSGVISFLEWEKELVESQKNSIIFLIKNKKNLIKNNYFTLFLEFVVIEKEKVLLSFLIVFNNFLKKFEKNDKMILSIFKKEIYQDNLKILLKRAFSTKTKFMKITIIQVTQLIHNILNIIDDKKIKIFLYKEIKNYIIPLIQFIIEYDLDTRGLVKIAFYLEDEFLFENKKFFKKKF